MLPRKKKSKTKTKRVPEEKLKSTLMMFDRMPDECLACEEPFDKQNKEMVSSWYVVVREKEEIVRLYCPICWGKAQQVVKTYITEKEKE